MERLHKLMFTLGLGIYITCCPPLWGAPNYCSLRVRALAPDGRQPEVSIEIREKNGRREEKEQSVTGYVEFCDLGIDPVTVVVGDAGCNQVTVADVPLSWNEPYTLRVTYDIESCLQDLPKSPTPYCEVLLRIAGPDGQWIADATVKFDDPNWPQLRTDDAGRAHTILRLKDTLRGSVVAVGYKPKSFAIVCQELRKHEEILTLAKKSAN
ncbi:MAG: hypothetical protein WCE61_13770 [Candidatus Acidiferrum sp.]